MRDRPRLGLRGVGLVLLLASCGGGSIKGGGGADAGRDVPIGPADANRDQPGSGDGNPGGDAGPTPGQPIGAPCTAPGACTTGFCADGVCCSAACTDACFTCAALGSVGTCLPADVGTDPRDECDDQGIATCGTDGVCDGAGACRRYASGAVCKPQSCTGSTLTAASRCDGDGACVPPAGQSCAPFACGRDGKCLTICANDGECIPPDTCVSGSCGKKPLGGTCGNGAECNSGFCEEGVCCSTTCTGTCRSCALPGSAGSCTDVPTGQDPLGQCADGLAASCGTDGFCDGKGGCRKYASGTVCLAPSCSGSTLTIAGRCDGAGACVAGTQQSCDPYVCGSGGQCLTSCTTNANCNGVNVCNGTSCGKRLAGVDCTASGECASGFCHQSVCCATACTGTCMSCALAGTRGVCTAIPAGSDPMNQCADNGGAACGTNGACNGGGACQLYAPGSACSGQTCTGATMMLTGRCDGVGNCVPGASQTCMPYVCGAQSCLTMCATTADCSSGNVCGGGSCGKLPLGATCAAGTDCLSGICAQRVCCQTACTATCMSCSLTGTSGTCSTVPAGDDPLDQCNDQGGSSCGTDGACDGLGGCRRYASGTPCGAATCTLSTYTPPKACNGAGTCQVPAPIACAPYNCGSSGSCLATCTADTDCVAPNVCRTGQCTRKGPGETCTAGNECASGLCQQGVCCMSSCTGTCRSCAVAGSLGTCTPVPAGSDPLGQCDDNGAPGCGTDGTCDGAGGCHLYAAGTNCASATCAGVAFTPARTCNGSGSCQAATPTTCDPYVCGPSGACLMSCTTSNDCNPPNTCISGSCGKKQIGAVCAAAAECNSGFCEQQRCCSTTCAGTCRSCALAGTPGTCTSVPAGQDPLNQCDDLTAATCGTDGTCNGSGGCRSYALGTECLASTCTGTTFTPARTCNGSGTCQTTTATTCGNYVCDTGGVCRTTCSSNSHCVAPNVCIGTSCSQGLVALYAFDQTSGTVAVDSSGNNRNGTLVGAASFGTGLIGRDLNLTGTNGYADLPDGLLAAVRDCTIASWVRVRTDRLWQRVFDFGNNMTVNMFLTPHASTTGFLRFAITTGGNAAEQALNGTAALPIGTWKHVVVVLGSSGGVLYVDGVQVTTNAGLALRPADLGSTVNDWIGRSQYTADPFFDGEIDDFRLYLRALTAAEVTTLFNQR